MYICNTKFFTPCIWPNCLRKNLKLTHILMQFSQFTLFSHFNLAS